MPKAEAQAMSDQQDGHQDEDVGPTSGIKYDPIALRQPKDMHSWSWCCPCLPEWLTDGVLVHERVREVDGRDQHCGLVVWVLVVIAYILYVAYACEGLAKQRRDPPTNARVVPALDEKRGLLQNFVVEAIPVREWDFACVVNIYNNNSGDALGWIDNLAVSSDIKHCSLTHSSNCINNSAMSTSRVGELKIGDVLDWVQQVSKQEVRNLHLRMFLLVNPGGNLVDNRFREWAVLRLKGEECDTIPCTPASVPISFGLLRPDQPGAWLPRNDYKLQLERYLKLPPRIRLKDNLREEQAYKLVFNAQSMEWWTETPTTTVFRTYVDLWMPDVTLVYEEKETVTLTALGSVVGAWGLVVLAITVLLPLQASGRRRIWCCLRRCSTNVAPGLFRTRYKIWHEKLQNDIEPEVNGRSNTVEPPDSASINDMAVMELPSMEDRVADLERVLRRLVNQPPTDYRSNMHIARMDRYRTVLALSKEKLEDQRKRLRRTVISAQ